MMGLIETLSGLYGLVVIDAPPLLVVADAIPLARMVDGVIVVASLNKTTTDQARGLRQQLQQLSTPVLGVVANRVRSRDAEGGYYYRIPGEDEELNSCRKRWLTLKVNLKRWIVR